MSQSEGTMGGSPGDGFGGITQNVHLGPSQSYGATPPVPQPSNVYHGNIAQQQTQPGHFYQGYVVQQQPNNVNQGNVSHQQQQEQPSSMYQGNVSQPQLSYVYQGNVAQQQQQQQQPSYVYQGSAAQQQPSNGYQGSASQQQQPASNLYQGSAGGGGQQPTWFGGNVAYSTPASYMVPPDPTIASPYNLQSVTEGMSRMATPTLPTPVGSITQYATPPPQEQQVQAPPSPYASQASVATAGSYAARSAMAHGSTAGSVASSAVPVYSQLPPTSAGKTIDKAASEQAQQNRILTDATRKVQEHAYYMKQAMDRDDLPTVLDRASHMVGELGDHHALSPKTYYELHMRALDDMPNLEEYFLSIEPVRFVYDAVQYTPKVLPRLYLQVCAASALIRSGEEQSVTTILRDLEQAVKCVQNPVRGLFLRHYLLQALRDKLPDGKNPQQGTVEDAYSFVMGNFIEMNKLWVRLQHLPGDGKSKEQRKKRERERNELRILVGTNLVRLSQMDGVTSQIYGQVILPKILEQAVSCADPLAQAYLIDCIIQVFPDEYHIETLSILLAVCPKLRDKVNIRTILQSLMDRLANYYADEELLDEVDTNQVKRSLAMDSFAMFEECVQNVYNARGPKLATKEVIRLQTALLNFSLKCYPGHMEKVNSCLGVCVAALRQASNAIPADGTFVIVPTTSKLDEPSVKELEKLLSIPLDTLALKVLELPHYSDLLAWLPWESRRDVGMTMLRAIVSSGGSPPQNPMELEELFNIVAPVFREENAVPHKEHTARAEGLMKGLGVNTASESFGITTTTTTEEPVDSDRAREMQEENALVSKLIHLLDHEDTDVVFEMLSIGRNHLSMGGKARVGYTLVPVVFSALRLANRICAEEHSTEAKIASAIEDADVEKFTSEVDVVGEESELNAESLPHADGEAGMETNIKTELAKVAPQVETVVEKDDEANGDADIDAGQVGTSSDDPASSEASKNEAEKRDDIEQKREKSISARKVFVFLQKTVSMVAKANVELGIKLYLETALAADGIAALGSNGEFGPVIYELMSQAFLLYEDEVGDSKAQSRNIKAIIGTLLACQALKKEEYESLIPKAAQYSAKLLKKPDQCQMVALCAHLFYTTNGGTEYKDQQRSLECLKRALKLADASTSASASYVYLFVDLLDHYMHFFEKGNPAITDKYVSGLVALVKEHLTTLSPLGSSDAATINEAKSHFNEILCYIQSQKKSSDATTMERFSLIQCDAKYP